MMETPWQLRLQAGLRSLRLSPRVRKVWRILHTTCLVAVLVTVHITLSRMPTASVAEEVWILYGLWIAYISKHNLLACIGDWWYVYIKKQNGGKRIVARGNTRTAACVLGSVLGMTWYGVSGAMRPPPAIAPVTLPTQVINLLVALLIFTLLGIIAYGEKSDRRGLLAIFDVVYRYTPRQHERRDNPGKD